MAPPKINNLPFKNNFQENSWKRCYVFEFLYLLHLCFFKAIKNFDLNPHPSSSHLKILFIFSSSLFSFSGFLSFSMVETEEEEDEGSSFKKAWPFKLQCFFRRDFSGNRRSQSKHWWKFRDLSSIFSKGSGLFSAKLKQN